MIFDLPNILIVILNVLGIPITHFAIAWLTTQLPDYYFQIKQPFNSKEFSNPINPIYEKVLFIRLWKDKLPDAGPWLKGFSKGTLQLTSTVYLSKFIEETRRGELSHWLQLLFICSFITWNPWPANVVIILYSLLSNLPCIFNQRFTRQRMLKILHKRSLLFQS